MFHSTFRPRWNANSMSSCPRLCYLIMTLSSAWVLVSSISICCILLLFWGIALGIEYDWDSWLWGCVSSSSEPRSELSLDSSIGCNNWYFISMCQACWFIKELSIKDIFKDSFILNLWYVNQSSECSHVLTFSLHIPSPCLLKSLLNLYLVLC